MKSHFEYHDKIATILKEHPAGLSAPALAKILSVNLRQIQRLLAELKKKHLVASEGAGRATVYIASELRPVPYSFSFLKELIKTEVFSKTELDNFKLVGKRSGETVELDTFNSKIQGDSGYQGIQKIHANSELPKKRSKKNS